MQAQTNSQDINIGSYTELNHIIIEGAREHNLKNINVQIPRDKFIVITGVSGSGKSSLAFDTIYAEGQRRYVDCLSAYARQYLGLLKKADVDKIEGLSPSISIDQKSISHNPRSTVGTVTEIYDYLRLLFAKIGVQYCIDCNIPVEQKSLDTIVDEILEIYSGKPVQILAPIVRGRKGHYKELFNQFLKLGFTKVRVDGQLLDITPDMQLNRYQIHDIELVIDRLIIDAKHIHRITESVELALQKSEGVVVVNTHGNNGLPRDKTFSTLNSCPSCGLAYEPLAPNMFSFNSPYGACKKCDGLGEIQTFEIELLIPDPSLSIAEGGIAPLGKIRPTYLWSLVEAYCNQKEIDLSLPIRDLNREKLHTLLYGGNTETVDLNYQFQTGSVSKYKQKFDGLIEILYHLYETTPSKSKKRELEEFMTTVLCNACNGGRLKPENLAVKIMDKNIYQLSILDIKNLQKFFYDLPEKLSRRDKIISNMIIKEITERLQFMLDVGLSYLSINRPSRTLSGGEAQRIRLASQIGSKLVGITYILDEPSIGLHQHDNGKLINSLKNLTEMGNTVIVVEHDKQMMTNADYIVDIGPGAGIHGGEILISATKEEIENLSQDEISKSLTIQYLKNIKSIPIPQKRREGNGKWLILEGAKGNNLKNITLRLPLGVMICVTGMSGSGKSSLINDTLYPILARHFYKSKLIPLPYSNITGIEHLDKIIEIDQTPIGRTPRSNPATYTGLFTLIRDFYALLPESKIRGYTAGRFSFNVKGGRCEACEGAGLKKIEMNFLPEIYVECDICNGKRYNRETLMVKYKGKSIADVLEMTVEEALEFFKDIPKVKRKLKVLSDVGLNYITLGQQAPTLSGGEAQRIKLATELSKSATGKTMYLLDEPTTGLHFEDISLLLKLLNKLADKGNTIVIIEHNMDIIKSADWIIDLGPEGGDNGGYIIAEGTPEQIIMNEKSYTAKYLIEELKSNN